MSKCQFPDPATGCQIWSVQNARDLRADVGWGTESTHAVSVAFDRHGDGASADLGDTRCWQLLAFHPVYILRSIAHAPPEFPKPKVYKHGVPLVLASSPRYTAKEFLGC